MSGLLNSSCSVSTDCGSNMVCKDNKCKLDTGSSCTHRTHNARRHFATTFTVEDACAARVHSADRIRNAILLCAWTRHEIFKFTSYFFQDSHADLPPPSTKVVKTRQGVQLACRYVCRDKVFKSMVFCMMPPWSDAVSVTDQANGWEERTVVNCGHIGEVGTATPCNPDAITVGLLYYNSPNFLQKHLHFWNNLSMRILKRTRFIVVDDCSDEHMSASNIVRSLAADRVHLQVLTIQPPKILWNMPGALNLLMYHTDTCWTLRLDVDQLMLDLKALQAVAFSSKSAAFHQFHRSSPVFKVHPSNWLLHKVAYWRAGGSDEDFSGHYGHDDTHLKWMLLQSGAHCVTHKTPAFMALGGADRVYNSSMVRTRQRNSDLHSKKKSGLIRLSQRYLRFQWKCTSSSRTGAALCKHARV